MYQLKNKQLLCLTAIIIGATLLYILGAKPILPVAMVALGVWCLPPPQIFASLMARFFVSFLLNIAFLQLAAVAQFFILPNSNFKVLALFYALIGLVVLGWGVVVKARPLVWQSFLPLVNKKDIGGILVAAIFLLPFVPIVIGSDALLKIVEIGGLQSPDAQHHLEFIHSMVNLQHLDTTGYPKGFHIGAAFWQDAFLSPQATLSWQQNALLSFMQYLSMGAMMAYALYYLCIFWLSKMRPGEISWLAAVSLALSLGAPLALLALWPFITLGFLNYYYVAIALAIGLIFVGEYGMSKRTHTKSWLLLGLLLFFGVSLSWLLLIPVALFAVFLIIPRPKLFLGAAVVRQLNMWQVLLGVWGVYSTYSFVFSGGASW